MERRWGTRKSVEVDVVIDNQPAGLRRGRIGNVSAGGVFVRIDPEGLATKTPVELLLQLHDNGTRVHRMPAIVARLTPSGAGFTFDQYNVEAFRALVVLLLATQLPAAGARRRRIRLPLFVGDGTSAGSAQEGTNAGAAAAAPTLAPALPQLSPVCGEPH